MTKNISLKNEKAVNEVSLIKILLCAERKDPGARIALELNFARITAYLFLVTEKIQLIQSKRSNFEFLSMKL